MGDCLRKWRDIEEGGRRLGGLGGESERSYLWLQLVFSASIVLKMCAQKGVQAAERSTGRVEHQEGWITMQARKRRKVRASCSSKPIGSRDSQRENEYLREEPRRLRHTSSMGGRGVSGMGQARNQLHSLWEVVGDPKRQQEIETIAQESGLCHMARNSVQNAAGHRSARNFSETRARGGGVRRRRWL